MRWCRETGVSRLAPDMLLAVLRPGHASSQADPSLDISGGSLLNYGLPEPSAQRWSCRANNRSDKMVRKQRWHDV